MNNIIINNLTFGYDSSKLIFENVNININTSWRLGITGRNGQGKSTLFKILSNQLEYSGTVTSNVQFNHFPLQTDNIVYVKELVEKHLEYEYFWKVSVELSKLGIDDYIFERQYESLSGGEQTKLMLAILFSLDNNFLLIDEPTNHLDSNGRRVLAKYLETKSGYIIISHDVEFLDSAIDHVIAIERAGIKLYKTKMSVYLQEKQNTDNLERAQNSKLRADINRLEIAKKQKANWSDKNEASKTGDLNRDGKPDTGFIGRKAAKLMKQSKVIERRMENQINEKQRLMNNIDIARSIKINPLLTTKMIVSCYQVDIEVEDKKLISKLTINLKSKDTLLITGDNGSGKSSLLNRIIEKDNRLKYIENVVVSSIPQSYTKYSGTIKQYCNDSDLDLTTISTMLINLGLERRLFETNLSEWSSGQYKKLLLVSSIATPAHVYIWDEPLNYLDIASRKQIIELVRSSDMTLIVVEHDSSFKDGLNPTIIEL